MNQRIKKALAAAILGVALPAMVGSAADPDEDQPLMIWAKGAGVLGLVFGLAWAADELKAAQEVE